MDIQTSDLRCIFCDGDTIVAAPENLACQQCGYAFPRYRDVDFLGAYGVHDTLGLMEVTSKISSKIDVEQVKQNWRNSETHLKEKYDRWMRDEVKMATKDQLGSIAQAQNVRLREWAAFQMLAENVDFEGKKVLDNGAGLGSDTLRLINRGADVTCVDFNPTSVHLGKQLVPEARWIAATSECLPFNTDSFDISVANAALHHMHDFSKAFDEMLRVTRPGGTIMVVSDPFIECGAERNHRERIELEIFARHPMVLGGVNEGMLPFDEYFECLKKCEDVTILTMKIHGYPGVGDKPKEWDLSQKTLETLGAYRGNVSAMGHVPEQQVEAPVAHETIPAAALFDTIGSPAQSWDFLTPYLNDEHIDCFPFANVSKFDLMNGWLPDMQPALPWRSGYNRMRIFVTRERLHSINGFEVKRYDNGNGHLAQVQMTVNASPIKSRPVSPDRSMTVPVEEFANLIRDRNVIEIAIKDGSENQGAVWSTFNSNRVLSVRMF